MVLGLSSLTCPSPLAWAAQWRYHLRTFPFLEARTPPKVHPNQHPVRCLTQTSLTGSRPSGQNSTSYTRAPPSMPTWGTPLVLTAASYAQRGPFHRQSPSIAPSVVRGFWEMWEQAPCPHTVRHITWGPIWTVAPLLTSPTHHRKRRQVMCT